MVVPSSYFYLFGVYANAGVILCVSMSNFKGVYSLVAKRITSRSRHTAVLPEDCIAHVDIQEYPGEMAVIDFLEHHRMTQSLPDILNQHGVGCSLHHLKTGVFCTQFFVPSDIHREPYRDINLKSEVWRCFDDEDTGFLRSRMITVGNCPE